MRPFGSIEGRHLQRRGLLVNRRHCCSRTDAFIGLPGFAGDVFVGRDRTFGRHAKHVGLQAHVGGKFALALRPAVEADRAVEILVAIAVGELGGEVARLGDRAAVELPGAVGRADEGADDALKWICMAFSARPSFSASALSMS